MPENCTASAEMHTDLRISCVLQVEIPEPVQLKSLWTPIFANEAAVPAPEAGSSASAAASVRPLSVDCLHAIMSVNWPPADRLTRSPADLPRSAGCSTWFERLQLLSVDWQLCVECCGKVLIMITCRHARAAAL